jgi:hypothetical protein
MSGLRKGIELVSSSQIGVGSWPGRARHHGLDRVGGREVCSSITVFWVAGWVIVWHVGAS